MLLLRFKSMDYELSLALRGFIFVFTKLYKCSVSNVKRYRSIDCSISSRWLEEANGHVEGLKTRGGCIFFRLSCH